MPFKNINNIQINYEITGKKDGEPLLLIHGLGSSLRDWENQIQEFSKKYKVITLDLRGHGKSSKMSKPFSIRGFAEDCILFLKSLNIGSAHVLGISMGAAIGFEFAIYHPNFIRSLIAVNMSVKIPVKTFKEKFNFYLRVFVVKLLGMKKMGVFLAPKIFPSPDQEELRTKLIKRWAENDKKSYLSALSSLKNWSVEDELNKIDCPTLIVASDGDYSSVESKEEYTKNISKGKIAIIKDSHHAVPVEKPEEFNKIVLKFLEEI